MSRMRLGWLGSQLRSCAATTACTNRSYGSGDCCPLISPVGGTSGCAVTTAVLPRVNTLSRENPTKCRYKPGSGSAFDPCNEPSTPHHRQRSLHGDVDLGRDLSIQRDFATVGVEALGCRAPVHAGAAGTTRNGEKHVTRHHAAR